MDPNADARSPLEAKARALVNHLAQGELDELAPLFDPQSWTEQSAGTLSEAWETITELVGPFQAVEEVSAQETETRVQIVATCRFARGHFNAKVSFAKDSTRVAGVFFEMVRPDAPSPDPNPPPYANPSAFTESAVRVGPESDALDGTLSVPMGEQPVPAVVLVHGSGPHDRDGTIGANRPFWDLALGLASRGIAVLRYEKRSKAHPVSLARRASKLTVREETIDDAVAAVQLLRNTPRIDPSRVYVLGYSFGGMLAPRIAAAAPDTAGLIVLAGNARPLEDVLFGQITYLLGLEDELPEGADAAMEELRQKTERVKSTELTPESAPAPQLPLGLPASYWLDLRGYSPPDLAKQLDKPVLVIQGGRDYQTTDEDFALWKAALTDSPRATLLLFPELDHLFLPGVGKSQPKDYDLPGHVAAEVVEAISDFILHGRR